jgi:hypothetical protein
VLDHSNTLDAVTFIVPDKINDSGTHGNITNSGGTANSGGKRSSPPPLLQQHHLHQNQSRLRNNYQADV